MTIWRASVNRRDRGVCCVPGVQSVQFGDESARELSGPVMGLTREPLHLMAGHVSRVLQVAKPVAHDFPGELVPVTGLLIDRIQQLGGAAAALGQVGQNGQIPPAPDAGQEPHEVLPVHREAPPDLRGDRGGLLPAARHRPVM